MFLQGDGLADDGLINSGNVALRNLHNFGLPGTSDTSGSSDNSGNSAWDLFSDQDFWKRTLDSLGSNQEYNSAQAQIDRDFASSENEKARAFNSEQAQMNRDFQERMSNTAYQRAVSDMQKAGLNPYLAITQGGASSPSGSSATSSGISVSGARSSGSNSFMEHAVSSAFQLIGDVVSGVSRIVSPYKHITNKYYYW